MHALLSLSDKQTRRIADTLTLQTPYPLDLSFG